MKYSTILIFVLLAIAINPVAAQNFTHNETLNRSYHVKPGATVDITNKFGKIQVENWQKDSVKIKVSFSAAAKSYERLAKLKNTIMFDFSGNESYVTAKTRVGSQNGTFVSDISDITSSLFSQGSTATMDFMVYMPSYCSIRINNNFGDVYLPDISGDANIYLAHGDLRAGNFARQLVLTMSFSNGFIRNISEGKLVSEYSTIEIKKVDKLRLESKSSNLNIEAVKELSISSRRDNIDVNEISSLSGSGSFTRLYAGTVSEEIVLNTNYGSLKIDRVKISFDNITLTSKATDISLCFEPATSFQCNLTYRASSINYPRENSNLQTRIINTKEEQYTATGFIGRNVPSPSKLTIMAERCDIRLFYK
jgi:hypothetical protein